MVGAEVIYGMQKAVKEFEKSGMVKILTDSRVTKLLTDDVTGQVIGVEYIDTVNNVAHNITAPNVVLATGGFASDRNASSYLAKFRPEYLKIPATAGHFSTGDGITLATSLGAGTVDMDKVQIHPTGWVDPKDPENPTKILAAELMRGVGGLLLNSKGERFCNEVGTRAYVTDKMLSHDPYYEKTKEWSITNDIPTFYLVLSSSAAQDAKKHVDHYTLKGLLTKVDGVEALSEKINIDVDVLTSTFQQYQKDAVQGMDAFGKSVFRGVPQSDLEKEVFYVGKVTPVLHYCMGGITIDTEGNVLDVNQNIIPGLHAAGEVSGGVHGGNRLAGNSLLECTVFGTIVGKKIPVQDHKPHVKIDTSTVVDRTATQQQIKQITIEELSKHKDPEDCWVVIQGTVYDLTSFADEHPPGAESIYKLGGLDGTDAFLAVHNQGLLDDFKDVIIGTLVSS